MADFLPHAPKAETGPVTGPTGDTRQFTRAEQLKIRLGSWLGYLAIALIGSSLRWETEGSGHLADIHARGRQAIFTSWHSCIAPATWYWRQRGIVVMTSLNLDGEIIAGCIRRHGYGAARGSSSRAGFRALGEMVRSIRQGLDVGFTIDGPRGPRYVAKQGPVILARKTGAGVLCFHIGLKRKIQLNSWDRFQIPLPFTRARTFIAPPLWIDAGASEDEVRACHDKMQTTLDDLRARAEHWET